MPQKSQIIATACFAIASLQGSQLADPQTFSSSAAQRAFLKQYCFACHNEQSKVAGLALDRMDLSQIPSNAEVWEKVIAKLKSNAMPPAGMPRPSAAHSAAFLSSLEGTLDRTFARHPNPGRTNVHRLNRVEYANSVRDLLAVDIDPASLLPPDDSGYGFDNNADVLSVSPMLTERYLTAARKISRIAVGDPRIRPTTESFAPDKLLRQSDRVDEDLPFGSRGGMAVRYYFPVTGSYVVKIFLLRTNVGLVRGPSIPNFLEVRLNGAIVKRVPLGSPGKRRAFEQDDDVDGTEVRFSAQAGPGIIAVTFTKNPGLPEGMERPLYSITSYEYSGDVQVLAGVRNIEIRGPYDVQKASPSPSRERIFTCYPQTQAADDECAHQIISTLARRAYRRPVNSQDLQPLIRFYKDARSTQNFDGAIEMALERILMSPDFLFRVEHDPPAAVAGKPYLINDLELASRLSFFLWSSIPDDELLLTAARGQLRAPGILEKEVKRMLADRRSQAMVENFAGQWLWLRNISLKTPDPYAFPDFDANLQQAFASELNLFLESQVRENRSVLNLLNADYTFLNERLARHYGIPNVYGAHFRRVQLTDTQRFGLLGKGGILMVTSYANRTSPVQRGKWLLENVLGAPPPPPPPNVPALQENSSDSAAKSVRERMEEHRANPACSGCHKLMDPLGFALENFDAVGHWRLYSEAGSAIDASGKLVDGTSVNGPVTLRNALLAHPESFVTTLCRKLTTYALGRGVDYFDEPVIRHIVRESAADDYRWSSLILGIVRSAPFQMRMAKPAPDTQQLSAKSPS